MNELDSLRQEAETLKNAIRVSSVEKSTGDTQSGQFHWYKMFNW